MSEKKTTKVRLVDLKRDQIVWSEYFNSYVMYKGLDFDEDFIFEYVGKKGYCIIIDSDIYDPPSLIKELL